MGRKTITLLFMLCIALLANAQKDKGKIKISGYTTHTDSKGKKSAVPDANVNVYKGAEKIQELKTNKKGHYEVQLDFGYQYKIAFENNPGYINMCFGVDGKVPPAKQDLNPSVDLDVPLLGEDTKDVDTLKFRFPFTKLKFDGNKKFVDDAKYLNDFQRGLFKEYKDAQKQIKKQKADKAAEAKADATAHYMLIGGKLVANDSKTPLRNVRIHLINEKGNNVETVATDKYGRFSFTKLALDRNYTVKMDENDSLKLSGAKIAMLNRAGKTVYMATAGQKGGFEFKFLASDKANLIQLEIDDNSLLVAGKLEALLNDKAQPVSKVRVVLADAVTSAIYETVETDENGNFVFSKLPPDRNFIVRLEESSPGLANIKITMKDKSGNELAAGNADGFGKFRFQMLASDRESMNKMQIDEAEVKMDLVGKFLMADDNNTPLAGIKVDLLDDDGIVQQSSIIDDKGMFIFKNLILYGGYYFSFDPADAKVSTLNAVVLAQRNNKAIKEYKIDVKAPQGIKYRILTSDQKTLGKLYLR